MAGGNFAGAVKWDTLLLGKKAGVQQAQTFKPTRNGIDKTNLPFYQPKLSYTIILKTIFELIVIGFWKFRKPNYKPRKLHDLLLIASTGIYLESIT
ncbi:MAG TPA: hypothetical protein VGN20_12890 [Mucilaginibacter sp.]|jgi:hypothetical protein